MVQVKRIANKNASEYASKFIEFNGSNLHGSKEGEFYIVWSYGWYPLFIYSYQSSFWYENEDRYSVSTSKQKSQSRPSEYTIKLSVENMRELAKCKYLSRVQYEEKTACA